MLAYRFGFYLFGIANVGLIIREYVNRNIYSSEIITQLINTIVIVVARNIAMFLPEQIDENSEEKSLNILQYIQSNICYPEKIKAKAISQHYLHLALKEFYCPLCFFLKSVGLQSLYFLNSLFKWLSIRKSQFLYYLANSHFAV